MQHEIWVFFKAYQMYIFYNRFQNMTSSWIYVMCVCACVCAFMCVKGVLNSETNPFLQHFTPMTNLIRIRCISEMSYMPVYFIRGLSHLYLFNKTVVFNDKADTFNRFVRISLTVQINKQ